MTTAATPAAALRIEAPAPGIYPDVDEKTYRAWDAANVSLLKVMHEQSPRHVHWELNHKSDETDAMRFGSAMHCYILRPEDFEEEWLIAKMCGSRTATGSACRNEGKYFRDGVWACGVHGKGWPLPSQRVISEGELGNIQAIDASIRGHRRCRALLEDLEAPVAECAIVWIDPATGVTCKALLDLCGLRDNRLQIVDLKSCLDAAATAFSRQIADFMYQMQAAFYLDGLTAVSGGEAVENFHFIAIEKDKSFACAPYHLHQEDIALGRAQYRAALEKWKFCHENNAWPGYPGGAIHVPEFYFKQQSKLV